MFQIMYRQNQQLMIGLFGGATVLFAMILSYWAVWRPRFGDERSKAPITGAISFFRWWFSFTPWILILTYIGIIIYVVWQTTENVLHPPNI